VSAKEEAWLSYSAQHIKSKGLCLRIVHGPRFHLTAGSRNDSLGLETVSASQRHSRKSVRKMGWKNMKRIPKLTLKLSQRHSRKSVRKMGWKNMKRIPKLTLKLCPETRLKFQTSPHHRPPPSAHPMVLTASQPIFEPPSFQLHFAAEQAQTW